MSLVKRFAAVAVVAVVSVGPGAGTALAEGGGATTIKDVACGVDPRASGLPVFLFEPRNSHLTVTPSGNATLVCHFAVSKEIAPDRATVNEGFFCGVGTRSSRVVVTPGGQVILTCHFTGRPQP